MTERNWNGVSGISADICRHLRSVSIVPVGLSKYRDGLYPLEPFTKEDAQNVLECVHRWQKMLYAEYGLHFIHCSDEWYILAEQSMPPEEQYDGYLQLENGVGMLRLLDTEIQETVQGLEGNDTFRHFSGSDRKTGSALYRKEYFVCSGKVSEYSWDGLCDPKRLLWSDDHRIRSDHRTGSDRTS